MSLTDRVFKAFENELVKHLRFSFTLNRRVDAAGRTRNRIRVWMRNDSGIVLKNIRGSIGPGPMAHFRFTTFCVERLGPRKESEIAQIDVDLPKNRIAHDQMAVVNVSGEPDLSTYRFKETGRELTYVAARIPVAGTDESAASVERFERPTDDLETIPLDWSRVSGKKPA